MDQECGRAMARLMRTVRAGAALLFMVVAGCESLLTRPGLYGTVTVTAARRSGEPIAGAPLVLYTGQRPMGYGTTDSTGRYTFLDVPEGVYGVYASVPSGYARPEELYSVASPSDVVQELRVLGGATRTARFEFLRRGPGSIAVQVSEPAGAPVSDTRVLLFSPRGVVREANTDRDGRVMFAGVPFGNYGVFAERPLAYVDSGETTLPARDGLIVEAGSSEQVRFTFERCVGSIAASVRDQFGGAVPGASLLLYSGAGVQGEYPVTGDRLQLGSLPCGEYGLRVRLPRGFSATEGRGATFVDGLRIRRGRALQASFTVVRIGSASMRIRVVDQTDAPVSGARAVLYTSAGIVRDGRTDAAGQLVFTDILVDGEYGLRVVNPTGYVVEEGRGRTFEDGIRLRDGETRNYTFRFTRP